MLLLLLLLLLLFSPWRHVSRQKEEWAKTLLAFVYGNNKEKVETCFCTVVGLSFSPFLLSSTINRGVLLLNGCCLLFCTQTSASSRSSPSAAATANDDDDDVDQTTTKRDGSNALQTKWAKQKNQLIKKVGKTVQRLAAAVAKMRLV